MADFYAEVMASLEALGVATRIWPMPVEIEGASVAFSDDRVHTSYEPEQAHRFWLLLLESQRVFEVFRSRYLGKASPIHLFWGALGPRRARVSPGDLHLPIRRGAQLRTRT